MRRRRLLRTSAAALTLGFAGCGQGDDGTATPDDDTPTEPPASTAAVTDDEPTATATPSPTAAPTESPTPTATETSSPTPTATPSPTETASPTATETATPAPPPADAAQVVEVSPEDDSFSFDPASFEVAAGETVAWVWRTDGHNVRPDSTPEGSDWTGTPGGDSEVYDEGYEHAYTFETLGEYAYYCAPHEGLDMVGEFTVTE